MRIADYIKPTRQVRDLERRSPSALDARIQDSYAPIYYRGDADALNNLSRALASFNPALIRLRDQAADKQYRTEVAEGYALARKYAGQDMSLADFHQLVREGKAPELRKLSKYHEHGINTFQMSEAAESMSAQMNKWYDEFVTPDGKRLAEITDPLEFDRIYNQAESQFWQEKTGGQYDPELYQKIYATQADSTRSVIFRKYLNDRAEAKLHQAQSTLSQYLDTTVRDKFGTAEYINNPKAWQKTTTEQIEAATALMARTTSTDEAHRAAAQYMTTMFNMGNTPKDFDRMYAAMQKTSAYKNPTYRSNIDNAYRTATWQYETKQAHLRAEARARRAEARLARQEAEERQAANILSGYTPEQLNDPETRRRLFDIAQQKGDHFVSTLYRRLNTLQHLGPDASMDNTEFSMTAKLYASGMRGEKDLAREKRMNQTQLDVIKMIIKENAKSEKKDYDDSAYLKAAIDSSPEAQQKDAWGLIANEAIIQHHREFVENYMTQANPQTEQERETVRSQAEQAWGTDWGFRTKEIVDKEYKRQTGITLVDPVSAANELSALVRGADRNTREGRVRFQIGQAISNMSAKINNGNSVAGLSGSEIINHGFLGSQFNNMAALSQADADLASAGLTLLNGEPLTHWMQIITLGVSGAQAYRAKQQQEVQRRMIRDPEHDNGTVEEEPKSTLRYGAEERY